MDTQTIKELVKKTKAYNCIECGKCSSICPISLINGECLPRITVRKAIFETTDTLFKDQLLWSCMTCGLCSEFCEFNVDFLSFIKLLRIAARKQTTYNGQETINDSQQITFAHNDVFNTIMNFTALSDIKQNRLNWLTQDIKVKRLTTNDLQQTTCNKPLTTNDSLLYFTGCLPYFASFFSPLPLIDIAKSTVKLLNLLNKQPILLQDERCCGHDLLWTGDLENFKILAKLNIETFKQANIKQIVTSCPECYYTLKYEYPNYFAPINAEILHISQLLAQNLPLLSKRLTTNDLQPSTTITYQDPCRLARFSGIYEEPRNVLNSIKGVTIKEMEHTKKSAICCGPTGWMNCGTIHKQIQLQRLKEVKNTKAELLVTSCHKCLIHLNCAMKNENTKLKIQDLPTFITNFINS